MDGLQSTEDRSLNYSNPPEEVEEEETSDEEEGDSDDDIDAEAEAIARRLGEELMAGLASASAELTTSDYAVNSSTQALRSRREQAIILTMTAILALIENDSLATSSLSSATIIPTANEINVLDFLKGTVASGTVPWGIAMPLSHVLVSLARSEALFGNLRHSNASSIQLDKGKRKRDEEDDNRHMQDFRALKRPSIAELDLEAQLNDATRAISNALQTSPMKALNSEVISSIRLQLHQVFLFAMTSSSGGRLDMHLLLQEIGGLIQVVGVLSGIQIGQTDPQQTQQPSPSAYPWAVANHSQQTDIGTAVYPCQISGCKKMFARLYQLRSHQRLHAAHRPFHCTICPASFARNHDLKRHIKLHENKAWRCGGCLKVFSRRDAIKRHKNSSRTRGVKGEQCIDAEIHEIQLDEEGDDRLREERRAKLWTGMANTVPQASIEGLNDEVEEGELQPEMIGRIQNSISSLHGLLQAHVSQALGAPQSQHVSADPTTGQATLADVIARAQLQSSPTQHLDRPTNIILNTNQNTSPATQLLDAAAETKDKLDSQAVLSSLSMYGLSDEQARLLEEAIATAAAAAQAQAEAEAALEEEEDDESSSEEGDTDDGDDEQTRAMDWVPT